MLAKYLEHALYKIVGEQPEREQQEWMHAYSLVQREKRCPQFFCVRFGSAIHVTTCFVPSLR